MNRATYLDTYTDQGRDMLPETERLALQRAVEALVRRGITKTEIAERAGIHKAHITRLSSRAVKASGRIQNVSRAYGIAIRRGILDTCIARSVPLAALGLTEATRP